MPAPCLWRGSMLTGVHCAGLWHVALPPRPTPPPGDGAINEEDLTLILRQLAGSSLTDAEVSNLVRRVFAAAGASSERGLTFAEYREALAGTQIGLQVEVPVED